VAFTVGNPTFVFGTAALGNTAPSVIQVLPVAGGVPVAITDSAALNVSPVWAPDGRGLFFVSNRGGARDIWFQPLADNHRPRGEPVRLTTGLQAHTIDLSSDGSRLLYSALALQANIWRVPIPGNGRVATPAEATPITTGSQAIEGLGVSQDGRWLAFDSDLSGNQEIFKIPAAGGTAERLTNHPADDFIPAWSPDGERIAFYSFRGGNRDIFVMGADGGSLEQVTSDPTHERVPDWSPDGRRLVFYSDRTGRAELFVVERADGGRWLPPRQLTREGGGNPRWSPDGRFVAYRGGFSVKVIPAEGGEPRTVVPESDPAKEPAPHWMEWSPDGRTIYFKTLDPDGRSTIFSVPAAGGTPRPVLMFPDPARQSPRTEFATDGRFLYFTLGSLEADISVLELRGR
jgi:Tol biopolymer transport system component